VVRVISVPRRFGGQQFELSSTRSVSGPLINSARFVRTIGNNPRDRSFLPRGKTEGVEKMGRDGRTSSDSVIGPDGRTLTLADLPQRETTRWVTRRKAEVVAAVQGGLLSLDEACERYCLSVEEFLSWQHAIARHGMEGLRATHVQEHREH
jgi:hypothetical protein